jgi:hypothetical protein
MSVVRGAQPVMRSAHLDGEPRHGCCGRSKLSDMVVGVDGAGWFGGWEVELSGGVEGAGRATDFSGVERQ